MTTTAFDLWARVNDAELEAHKTDVDWPTWRDRVEWTKDGHIYRGSTTLTGRDISQPLDFRCVESWSDQPYRICWVSSENRVILTFCEGDLTYEAYSDGPAFRNAVNSAARFYARNKT